MSGVQQPFLQLGLWYKIAIKLRQIFTAFVVSLSGQKIKFLIIIISAVCKYFKLSLLTSFFDRFFFIESILTGCDSCAPRGKIN